MKLVIVAKEKVGGYTYGTEKREISSLEEILEYSGITEIFVISETGEILVNENRNFPVETYI